MTPRARTLYASCKAGRCYDCVLTGNCPLFVRFVFEGVKRHRIEGTQVPVYTPAKTVADCFKYRNKVGLVVALEALRDCWRQRKASMDELWKHAKICRVGNVMRPYLESLT